MNRPKLKRDWEGLRVMSTRSLTNGFYRAPAGTFFTVMCNRGGLRMESDSCKKCGVSTFFSKVSEHDVEIVGKNNDHDAPG